MELTNNKEKTVDYKGEELSEGFSIIPFCGLHDNTIPIKVTYLIWRRDTIANILRRPLKQ